MSKKKIVSLVKKLIKISGKANVITKSWDKEAYEKGWRYGTGNAFAVTRPGNLLELWEILKACNKDGVIIIMQAANTGLTGGSTPHGNDYDLSLIHI